MFGVVTDGYRRYIAFPGILEILKRISAEAVKAARSDAEGAKDGCNLLSGAASPSGPGAMLEGGERGQHFFGWDAFRIAFAQKPRADISEEFDGLSIVGEFEDGGQGGAGFFRPRTADEVGEMNERLGAGLLAGCEARRDSRGDGGGDLVDCSAMVFYPGSKLFDQLETAFAGGNGMEAGKGVSRFSAEQSNGDAASSERAGQRSIAGEGFGTEEIILLPAVAVAGRGVRAGVEESDGGLALGKAEGVMAIIEEERALELVAVHQIGLSEVELQERASGDAGEERRLIGKFVEHHEADGFAGLGFGRTDVEINGGTKGFEAVGIGSPESEDGELVLVAEQVSADAGGDGIEELGGSRLGR